MLGPVSWILRLLGGRILFPLRMAANCQFLQGGGVGGKTFVRTSYEWNHPAAKRKTFLPPGRKGAESTSKQEALEGQERLFFILDKE